MCATRASLGTNAVLYGTMRENVHALTVVSATGEIVHTGTRAKKSSSGYDLTRFLLIGSEGTLGVITEVTVKLYAQPQAVSAAICQFPSIEAAVRATIQIIQNAIPIARCELLDEMSVVALNRHSKLGLQERPMLLMEFHGTPAGVKEQVGARCASPGGASTPGSPGAQGLSRARRPRLRRRRVHAGRGRGRRVAADRGLRRRGAQRLLRASSSPS